MPIRRTNLPVYSALAVLFILFGSIAPPADCAGPRQQDASADRSSDLRDFNKFLDDHPAIVPDLKRDPSLIVDPGYLARHPDLTQFLAAHPGFEGTVQSELEKRRCDTPAPDIFDQVSPAVVFIYATSINPYQMADRVEHVVGSGFIFDASGLILTNSHVAFGRQSIEVTLDNGASVPAQLVGADPIFDIAVLRIERPAKGTLPVARLGDSNRVRVGEDALAIGNPLGLEQTLTRGAVSAINRVLPPTFFAFQEPLIQIDTPINPGSSGGPLLNSCGEVIGITTAVVPDAQSIGFAIPINLAKEILPQLEKGKVIRGWLGVSIQDVTPELAKSFNLKDTKGALVADVVKDSPAQKAGIERGDIIVSFDGKAMTSAHELSRTVAGTAPNTKAKVEVIRGGKKQALTVQVGTMPGEVEEESKVVAAELGLSVQTLTPELAEQFEWPREEKGVLITGVEPGSAAEDGGLRRGDLIKEMNQKPVQTVDEYRRQLKKAKQGESILLLIKRGNQTFFVTVKKGGE